MRRALLPLLPLLLLAGVARADALPDEPGRVWDPASELQPEVRRDLEDAVGRAQQISAERILVVVSRPKGEYTPDSFLQQVTETWKERIVLVVLRSEWRVVLHTTETADARLPDGATRSWVAQIDHELVQGRYPRTVARVVREMGDALAGHPPKPWIAWQHPFLTLAGGQDADPLPWQAELGISLVVLLLLAFFVHALVTDPVGVLAWIGWNLLEAVIGGALGGGGGGGGGGGSSFSGGGGSSGGGGANGSW